MAESSSPVVARWELSRRLAARRKELGVDVKTITNALGFTRNYWSAVENDRTLIAEDKLRLLFDVLDFDEQDQTELLALRTSSRTRAWWDRLKIEEEARRFFGLEDGASQIRVYESLVIPGLLQTERYARATIGADPFFSAVQVDQIVDMRRERQAILANSERPQLSALVSEAAFRQRMGSDLVHREQIQHVITLASEHVIDLRIIPFSTNPGAIVSSSTLVLLDFSSEHLPSIAWQEAVRPIAEIDSEADEAQYQRLDLAWVDGWDRATERDQTIVLLESLLE